MQRETAEKAKLYFVLKCSVIITHCDSNRRNFFLKLCCLTFSASLRNRTSVHGKKRVGRREKIVLVSLWNRPPLNCFLFYKRTEKNLTNLPPETIQNHSGEPEDKSNVLKTHICSIYTMYVKYKLHCNDTFQTRCQEIC